MAVSKARTAVSVPLTREMAEMFRFWIWFLASAPPQKAVSAMAKSAGDWAPGILYASEAWAKNWAK